jgi:hypothetical protein
MSYMCRTSTHTLEHGKGENSEVSLYASGQVATKSEAKVQ